MQTGTNHALYVLQQPLEFVRGHYRRVHLAPYKEAMDVACGKRRAKRAADDQVKRILVIKAEVFYGANY